MKDTTSTLLAQARRKIADDMEAREIGAIIWSIPSAGFHYIPEIVVSDNNGDPRSARITGLYSFGGKLYAIEEDEAGVSTEDFYRPEVEVPPVVVTLSADKAAKTLGDPADEKGYTEAGTLEEWVAIADCYFEALAEA